MSDHRDDAPDGDPPDDTAVPEDPPDADQSDGTGEPSDIEPSDAEPIEIAEMSPPPPPPIEESAAADPPPPPPTYEPPASTTAGPATDPAADLGTAAAAGAGATTLPVEPRPFDQDAIDAEKRWPGPAKAWVIILALVALAAIGAAIWAYTDASSTQDDVDTLEMQLAAADARAEDAETRAAELEELAEATTGELAEERDVAIAERDAVIAERDAAVAERDALQAQLDADATAIEELQAQLDDIVNRFPITIAPDLGATDTAGTYAAVLNQVVCNGLPQCGSPPPFGEAVLARDTNGTLRLVVGNALDVPLQAVDGAMFGIAESHNLVQPCNDVARTARVSVALYAAQGQLGLDGELALTEIDGSIVVEVFADECGEGFSWYHADLTRS